MKVTLIGCGIMGSAIAEVIMNEGHELTIVEIDKEATAPFVKKGAIHADLLQEALDAELIYNNVPGHNVFMDILQPLSPGALKGKAIVNTTTSTPNDIKQAAERVRDLGGSYLDGTIEVYPSDIGTENGFIFYAGDKDVYTRYQELLEAIAGISVYLGDNVTHPSVMDAALVNSHYGLMFSAAEGAAMCLKHGIDLKDFTKYFNMMMPAMASMVENQVKSDLYDYTGEFIDADEASLEIEAAGLETMIEAMNEVDINSEFSEKVLELMNRAIEKGYGKKNFIAILTGILDK